MRATSDAPVYLPNMTSPNNAFLLYVNEFGKLPREQILKRITKHDLKEAERLMQICENEVATLRSGLLLAQFGKAKREEVISSFRVRVPELDNDMVDQVIQFAEWLIAKG